MPRHSKNKNNSLKKIVIVLLSIILICSIIYIIKVKLTEQKEYESQLETSKLLDTIEVSQNKVANPPTERQLQVQELQKQRSNIVGWLQIEDTNINYPVLQGTDNDYYINHNYKNETISSGSIFLDKDYDFTKPSSNLLIYGHRNKKGLMFEDLMKYADEDFYNNHKQIKFTTNTDDGIYEILAVFYSKVYYKSDKNVFRYYYFVNAKNETEYNEYVSNCKKASIYNTGIDAKYGEQLLTLSTCEYSQKNGRFVVVAKKVH